MILHSKKIELQWKLIKNFTQEGKSKFTAALTIKNTATLDLPASGWKLYFSLRYHGYNLAAVSPDFKIEHVNGDLFYLKPQEIFKGLKPGDSTVVEYSGSGKVANYQDAPSGFFLVYDKAAQTATQINKPTIIKDDRLLQADASAVFNKNKAVEDIPVERLPRVFPTPANYKDLTESFTIDKTTIISTDLSFDKEARYLANELEKLMGYKVGINSNTILSKGILLRKANLSGESYRLRVDSEKILIEAGNASGIFYGIQSLKTIFPPTLWKAVQSSVTIQGVEVSDTPRFLFRAFMLDVARNFQPKEEILKVLEIMSLYKMNVFHLHMSDDEGWRLEIPDLPELTEIGSTRGYPFDGDNRLQPSYGSGGSSENPSATGYYTRSDYIEIIKYAADRHIQVVPEIESPGHARAAIKAMQARCVRFRKENKEAEANRYLLHDPEDRSVYISPQYFRDNVMNVALPSTYAFIEKVIDELIAMHKEAGAPLTAIHMAGDEVPQGSWEKSPRVVAFLKEQNTIKSTNALWGYYFEQIKSILKKRGIKMFGWQELVVGTVSAENSKHVVNSAFLRNDLQLNAWSNFGENIDVPYRMANVGYKTVLTCFDHLYFDLAYQPSFDEPGDAWIGYLDVDRIFSFIPLDYLRNLKIDIEGNPYPENFFDGKEKLTKKGESNIVGIQGALWGENLVSSELMEYMLVPRLLALAERGWTKEPAWATETREQQYQKLFTQGWSLFVNTLGKRELPRLDYYQGGINYRIPTPGAMVSEGKIVANIQMPGFVIRYTTDGTEPNEGSSVYTTPIANKGFIKLKTFDTRNRSSYTISINNH